MSDNSRATCGGGYNNIAGAKGSINSVTSASKNTTTKSTSNHQSLQQQQRNKQHQQQSNSSSSGGNGSHLHNANANATTIWYTRYVFLSCVLLSAIILGITSYRLVDTTHKKLAETQYESIVERALKEALSVATRKQSGTRTMSKIVAQALPNANEYPFVTLPGFETISTSVLETSANRELGFLPIVEESQVTEFEEFAYNYFNERFPDTPTAGMSSFGKGIWSTDPTLPQDTDQRYHNTNGTVVGSNETFLTPILQHNVGPHPVLLLNVRSDPTRAKQIDDMLSCTRTRNNDNSSLEDSIPSCGAITDIVELRGQPVGTGPGAVVLEPIYPVNNPNTMTAILATTIVFDEILEDIFAESVTGIDCVLQTAEPYNTVFSYRIQNGIAIPIDFDDYHDTKYDTFKRSVTINANQYTSQSPKYTLHIYPSDEFYDTYQSLNPIIAMIGSIAIVIFTSLLFLVYDMSVRKEFAAKKDLLESKRQFVRYISHEVRTPLNAISIGLHLMQETNATNAGFTNSEELANYVKEKQAANEVEEKQEAGKVVSNNEAAAVVRVVDDDMQRQQQEAVVVVDPSIISNFTLVQDLLQNAQSSVDVLSDFLNYDKVEAGKLTLELAKVDIHDIIATTANEFRLSAEKKQIKYSVTFQKNKDDYDIEQQTTVARKLDVVIGDEARLRQVLRNLISNSLKFSRTGQQVEVIVSFPQVSSRKSNKQRKPSYKDLTLKEDGEGVVTTTRFECSQQVVRISVSDKGVGMTKSQLSKLFRDGYMQFNPNELQAGQGSGLGLYITRGIVEQHGGTVIATSPGLNQGSTFTVTLPLYKVPVKNVEATTASTTETTTLENSTTSKSSTLGSGGRFSSAHLASPSAIREEDGESQLREEEEVDHQDYNNVESKSKIENKKKIRPPKLLSTASSSLHHHRHHHILVVDDALSNRKLMCRLLQHHGHTTEMAEDGEVALKMVLESAEAANDDKKKKFFDTILLDYEMPICNGPEAARQIRSAGFDYTDTLFIVGVTGNMFTEDINTFISSGANAVLPKPFKIDALNALWLEREQTKAT